jgi:hypothetical protein
VGLAADPALRLRLVVGAADEESARGLHAALGKLLPALARMKEVRQAVPAAEKIVPLLTPHVRGDRLEVVLDEKALGEIVRPYLAHFGGSAGRARSSANLGRILQALHRYHDAHGRFPAAAGYGKDGRPLLSWRVYLLPYLGQKDLSEQFRLDEPWDSDHNKKLIGKMPPVFDSTGVPRLAAAGRTTYLAPRGEATMFPDKQGVRVADVADGTSNTIFVVDADDARAVPWTKPQDLDFDPADPARGLSTRFGDGYLLGFADGSVHFLPRKVSKADLRALFTRNGGEVVAYP